MIRKLLLLCAIPLFGCQSENSEAIGSTKEPLSINLIQAALKAPPNPNWTAADEQIIGPVWKGDTDKGALYIPLYRGATAAIEDYVYAPPDHTCGTYRGTVRIDWDKDKNTVHYLIKYRNVPKSPVIHRTEGVDWWPNPFHDAPKDLETTGFRLWSVFATINTALTHFYYDGTTLKLLGSEHDFPGGPPAGSITVDFPVFPLVSSSLMFPDEDGNLVHEYTTAYDHVTVEGGAYGHALVTDIPLDLCLGNPVEPPKGQLRPYVSPWFPPNEAPSWAEVLRSGLFLDGTIDDATVPFPDNNVPYVYSGITLMSNVPGVQGGVPNGWAFSNDSAFLNVSPIIRPVPGGNGPGCMPYVSEPHVDAPRYCEMQH